MNKQKSIIYVNYSPYENSGKILDFLLDNFEYVFLFSMGFHQLKNKKKYNRILIYENRKLREEHSFVQMPIPLSLTFYLLPIRSIVNFIQILWNIYLLKIKYGKIDVYFTVNAFTAWIGLILKKIRFVGKTIFWVWDYYPPNHENKIITIMRRIYWQFDKISSHSDRVVFVNRRLMDLRKKIGIIPQKANYPIVSIGTDLIFIPSSKKNRVILGFIGVIKKSQGLEMVFENSDQITKNFPDAKLEIVGSGPDEEYFRHKAKASSFPTNFHGYLEGDSFNNVLGKCSIGIATYIPDKSNVSHYGDPGKIKRYLSLGLPVIATNVFEFSNEISSFKAGEIIDYNNPSDFVEAIKKIMKNYLKYRENAIKLSKKYYYKKIYTHLFE